MERNTTLQPGIEVRIQVMRDQTIQRLKRGVHANALPTPPALNCSAFIWPYDGAFLVTTHSTTKKVFAHGRGTVACYHTFPTEDAAIMFALMLGENK